MNEKHFILRIVLIVIFWINALFAVNTIRTGIHQEIKTVYSFLWEEQIKHNALTLSVYGGNNLAGVAVRYARQYKEETYNHLSIGKEYRDGSLSYVMAFGGGVKLSEDVDVEINLKSAYKSSLITEIEDPLLYSLELGFLFTLLK
jgi:hypothetical protein